MSQLAQFPQGKVVEIHLGGSLLIVGERELLRLLNTNPELWLRALARGKAILRSRRAKTREVKDHEG